MSEENPTGTVAAWLMGQLGAISGLATAAPGGIWEDQLPEGLTAHPGIVFQLMQGTDSYALGGIFVLLDCVYQIKAVDLSHAYDAAEAAFGLVHDGIQRQSGAVVGGRVLYCRRQNPVRYAEVVSGGAEFKHLGGLYQFWAQ